MIEVAKAINSFAQSLAEQSNVPPVEESIFVLTASQLENIITKAIQDATKSLQDRISAQDDTIAHLTEDLASLSTTTKQDERITALENWREDQAEIVAGLIRATRQKPQPIQKDRSEILLALITANGGKMLAKEARQKMHMSRPLFSQLIAAMKDDIETRPYHLNKSAKVLILR